MPRVSFLSGLGALAGAMFGFGAEIGAQSNNADLIAPQRLLAVTLQAKDPPLEDPDIGGWFCQSVSRNGKSPGDLKWTFLRDILDIAEKAKTPPAFDRRLSQSEQNLRRAAFQAQHIAAENLVIRFDINKWELPSDFLKAYFRHPTVLQPSIVLDPLAGTTVSLFFHGCLTEGELAIGKKAALTVGRIFTGSGETIGLDVLPAGVTIEIRVTRVLEKPRLARLPAAAATGVGGSVPSTGAATVGAGAGATIGSPAVPGTGANREFPFNPALLKEASATPQPIPQRRRESYLAPSPPLADFDGPGECGQCRRTAMQQCFVESCSGYARNSMGIRNGTIGIVGQLNALAEKYNKSAASPETAQRFRREWITLKSDLDEKDRAYYRQLTEERKDYAACERKCQSEAAGICSSRCRTAKVGDKFSVPLGADSCRPVDTRLTDRPYERRADILKALGTQGSSGKRIDVAKYFAWRAAYETDPASLQSRLDRKTGEVTLRQARHVERSQTLRVPIQSWFQPKNVPLFKEICCDWDRLTGDAVRKVDYELRGPEYDYDFYVYFTDVGGIEKFAEEYMRPFLAAGMRPEAALEKAARSPVIAERIAKITDDAIGIARGKAKKRGDGIIHTLRLGVDISRSAGADRIILPAAAAWNLGWAGARLSGQLLTPWLTDIQRNADGTVFQSLVGKDRFSALGIERMPQRHTYRMRVKGKFFWPDAVCEIPKEAYNEVMAIDTAGRHLCGKPNGQVRQLFEQGVENSCLREQSSTQPGKFDGCWVYDGKQPKEVFISSRRGRIAADVAYNNRQYTGTEYDNTLYLHYRAVNPADRASMKWVNRDGSPTTIPVSVIRSVWPQPSRSSFILSGAETDASELVGKLRGSWIDYGDGKKTSVTKGEWPARWVRQDLRPRAVHFTGRDFASKVSAYNDPGRVFVRAIVDNNCQGYLDRLKARVSFAGSNAGPIEIDLVETTPFSGEFYSGNDGIPVPPGHPSSVSVTLVDGLKGGKAAIEYSGRDPEPKDPVAPMPPDFLKALEKRIDGLQSKPAGPGSK